MTKIEGAMGCGLCKMEPNQTVAFTKGNSSGKPFWGLFQMSETKFQMSETNVAVAQLDGLSFFCL